MAAGVLGVLVRYGVILHLSVDPHAVSSSTVSAGALLWYGGLAAGWRDKGGVQQQQQQLSVCC